jgi:hypothetical protein
MDDRTHPKTVTILVTRLLDNLRGRGLSPERIGANIVWVTNRAADPPDGAPLTRMTPRLRQAVLCRTDREDRLGWWWIWNTPDDESQQEWICPATEITMAADAIARVLALAPTNQRTNR